MSTGPKVEVSNLNEEAQRLEQLKSELVEAQAKLASEAQQQITSEEAHRLDTLKSEFAETQAHLELAREQLANEYGRQKHEQRLRVEVASDVRHEEAPWLEMPRRLAASRRRRAKICYPGCCFGKATPCPRNPPKPPRKS